MKKRITVVCGVISKGDRVFIARRKQGKALAGFWEFPGGKVETNEDCQDALIRELQEELGMKVSVGKYLTENVHDYKDISIRLIAYRCDFISATFKLTDHDNYEWILPNDLDKFDLAPADVPIMEILTR